MSKIDTMTDDMWVSVGDRLPDGDNDMLVWSLGRYMDIGWYNNESFRWYTTCSDDWIDGVTHWMPLPEPPEAN